MAMFVVDKTLFEAVSLVIQMTESVKTLARIPEPGGRSFLGYLPREQCAFAYYRLMAKSTDMSRA